MWFSAIHLYVVLQALALVNSLGINCKGSSECRVVTGVGANVLTGMNHTLSTLPVSANGISYTGIRSLIFFSGHDIICVSVQPEWVCLFIQGNNLPTAGVNGSVILEKLADLIDHGCHICGSVPISDDNDVNTAGELTVNWVGGTNAECTGYCYSGYAPSGNSGSYSSGAPGVSSGSVAVGPNGEGSGGGGGSSEEGSSGGGSSEEGSTEGSSEEGTTEGVP